MGFLSDLWGGVVRGWRDVWGRVVGIVSAVVSFFTNLWHVVGSAWDLVVSGVDALWRGAVEWAHAVYGSLRWLYVHVVPAAVRHAIATAIGWARREIALAVRVLRHLVSTVRDYLIRLVNELRKWARDAVRFLTSWLGRVQHWLDVIGRVVTVWVTHPQTLADALAGLIVRPMLRFLHARAETLARWLWGHLVGLILRSVNLFEGILAALF